MPNTLKKILNFQVCKYKINYSKFNPRNFKWSPFKKFIRSLAILTIFLGAFIIVKDEYNYQFGDSPSYENSTETTADKKEKDCNVSGIELRGEVVTYIVNPDDKEAIGDKTASEEIVYYINEAEKDDKIKAIILEVDSQGGYPVAGEEIAIAMKRAKKLTVAIIREYGDSAAYMAASGASRIFASKNSDVGGIGVTGSYLDNVNKNNKDGLNYISLSSGKFKDTGDPNKALTTEEKQYLMRDVNILHQNFVELVAENRNMDIEKVKKLADGSTMLGEMALQNGLIDQIGGLQETKDYLKDKIGEDIEICW
ncbi:MAG: S49 family peptidase [Patescibacteria group bacterium]|nr:S49 family peptidase [Patescibacteria group bacterium]